MKLTRIMSVLGAVVLGGVLVASTYGAQAAHPPGTPDRSGHGQHSRMAEQVDHFRPPMVHKYEKNGMRMGMHCGTSDMS
jgi:hypothetical protein